MFRYDEFKVLFDGLSEGEKKELLGNIFRVKAISVYFMEKREEQVIFRLYAEGIFYQYVFFLEDILEESYIKVSKGERMVCYQIYVGKDFRERFVFTDD